MGKAAKEQKKVVIIDGSGYIFRAFYAIQRLSTSKGFPTNAIYGFINMLMKVLEVEKPEKLMIAFDTGKATFRKEMFEDYKANRATPPDDLKVQFEHIFRAVDCFGITRIHAPGFEADDVIATVAKKAVAEGHKVEIITGDKDLMQLVTDDILLYDTMKDKRIDRAGVLERFQVAPEQIVDLLALMGDSSDNIPGVSGIGEKTAAELIKQFGSLDGIYEKLDQIKQPKRRETLQNEKETAYLSQKLATVRDDLDIAIDWEAMNYKGPKLDKLKAFFEEFEFQGLLKRFDFKQVPEKSFERGKYETVLTEDALKALVKELKGAKVIAVDTETTSLTPHQAKLVGISLSAKAGESYYVPVGHYALGKPEERVPEQLEPAVVRKHLKPVLEDPKIGKIGQNLKYDLQILRNFGIDLQGIQSDTLLESYVLDPEQPHNLDSLAFRHLGHQNITYEEVTGTGKKQINFAEVAIDKATQYAAEDADVTLRLHEKLMPLVEKAGGTKLLKEIELPLLEVLAEMEYCGILVDKEKLQELSVSLEKEIGENEKKIYELAGEPFNVNSPKQLSHVLFEKLKLPVIKKTKTGISTDESVLQKLAGSHDICKYIVKFREVVKLRSTYVEGLLAAINEGTGRVHTSYNQTVAATGRLSSSNPNLQNIPVEGEHDIRAIFIAPPGHELVSADYSQVELRLLASMSEDKELIRAFENDEDVHEYTARLIFGVDKVSPDHRRIAKTINFGVTYGQTPYGLSQMLKITPGEAKQFIDTYFARYSNVQKFMKGLVEGARANGYVTTLLGRRRYLPEINSSNRMMREMAERAAINAPVQGTAADMIKLAMVSLQARLKKENLRSRMVLQVHDELVMEVPKAEKTVAEKVLREEMESALKLKVPLKVEVGWGKNWRECDS